jgi:hypothetical protein
MKQIFTILFITSLFAYADDSVTSFSNANINNYLDSHGNTINITDSTAIPKTATNNNTNKPVIQQNVTIINEPAVNSANNNQNYAQVYPYEEYPYYDGYYNNRNYQQSYNRYQNYNNGERYNEMQRFTHGEDHISSGKSW